MTDIALQQKHALAVQDVHDLHLFVLGQPVHLHRVVCHHLGYDAGGGAGDGDGPGRDLAGNGNGGGVVLDLVVLTAGAIVSLCKTDMPIMRYASSSSG